jgi:hypothetical protein
VGKNLGLYGQILFKDARLNTCENKTFSCCTGAYDHGLTTIHTLDGCNNASGLFLTNNGHPCTAIDLGCTCRRRPTCSVRPEVLHIKYRHCRDDDDGYTRGCLCSSVTGNKYTQIAAKQCQRCPPPARITREGLCVNAFGQSHATQDVANFWDHGSIAFQIPSGIGQAHQVELSISGQIDKTRLFAYAPPTIERLDPATGPTVG